jgi:transcriptional regulator GlxA family with amidase domain
MESRKIHFKRNCQQSTVRPSRIGILNVSKMVLSSKAIQFIQVAVFANGRSAMKLARLSLYVMAVVFDCPSLDILVVPGGWGTRKQMENERLISWIAERGGQVETLTSVCTGSMLLGRATLLDHHHATTHWRSLDWMRKTFPDILVEDSYTLSKMVLC